MIHTTENNDNDSRTLQTYVFSQTLVVYIMADDEKVPQTEQKEEDKSAKKRKKRVWDEDFRNQYQDEMEASSNFCFSDMTIIFERRYYYFRNLSMK